MAHSFGALAVVGAALISAAPAAAQQTLSREIAVLQGLDKITARISTVRAPLDESVTFGTLEIVARTCQETPPEEAPESAAFLEIIDHRPDGPQTEVFSGWMFASSPAVSAMEHPVYDVWVIDCVDADEIVEEEDGAAEEGADEDADEGAAQSQ